MLNSLSISMISSTSGVVTLSKSDISMLFGWVCTAFRHWPTRDDISLKVVASFGVVSSRRLSSASFCERPVFSMSTWTSSIILSTASSGSLSQNSHVSITVSAQSFGP